MVKAVEGYFGKPDSFFLCHGVCVMLGEPLIQLFYGDPQIASFSFLCAHPKTPIP